ncbi:tigger transposable element-derived protein 1-like [Pantherophis guttatus]|uniref:Tigger transposable element-derived protein 1-like n=1 Tax=Pantherophis guttatus TaxID=94885 RepID=A0A6P9BDU2_PANGU|nr:tigger transposable element-derived protein 1-like [Pantherophis guttatus]
MEEQQLVVPKEEEEEEEGTESERRNPLIVQVRTLGDVLTQDRPSHPNSESKEEMHQCWNSQWQEFLKSVAGLPIPPPPLEKNGTDSQASLGRDKEDPQQESSGEGRESMFQGDPNVSGKLWTGREKVDSFVKVKVEETLEEANLESQAPLPLSSQDAEEPQEMSSKRKNPSPTETRRKRHRKTIDLNLKMKIIKAYEAGKKMHKIAKEEGLACSTICATVKDRERIREALKGAIGLNTNITIIQKCLIPEMEPLLILWIKDRIQKRLPLSFLLIQTKARSIFTTLKEQAGKECTETFNASHSWFVRFQQRFHYQILPSRESLRAEKRTAKHFLDELDDVVAEGNYSADQLFRVDETGLYWKRMLEQTCVHKEAEAMPGCKAFKDRVTLLLGGNVAGFKLTPFVILKSDHTSMIQKINKDTLPVYYRFDCETWMTHVLFEDWFTNCFIPQVKEYCGQKEIPFKILLLLDKVPGHALHLDSLHPDVRVVHLPQNITLLQPMCQRAILLFRAYYLQAVFAKALAATENDKISLHTFWKSYNILHCIENIVAAWEDFSVKSMQEFWKKCLKGYAAFANNFEGFSHKQNLDEINKNILILTKSLDLEVEAEDLKTLIAYTEGDLSNQDLIELKKELEAQKVREEAAEREREKVQVVEVKLKTFTEKRLAGIFSGVKKMLSDLESMDPDEEHFRKIHWEMCEILKCYHEIYERKKKENKDKETKLPSLLPFPSTGIKHPNNPQQSTSYASRSDVLENTKNHESFKGCVSNLMFRDSPDSEGYDANISQIRERGLGHSEGKASLEIKQENDGEANSLEYDI